MLRARLLTATAAIALFAAGAAAAQDQTAPAPVAAPAQDAAPAAQSPAAQPQAPAADNTIIDVLRERGEFSTLLSALEAAQLTDTLESQSAVSIFAPTDAAFAALPEAERTRLLDPANAAELRQLLLYHVIVADVNSSQIEGALGGVETAARTQVQLDGTGDAIKIDNATVTQADIDAGNGTVFVIDQVLNPAQSLVATGDAEETSADAAAPASPSPEASSEAEATTNTPSDDAADAAPMASPPAADPADGQSDEPEADAAQPQAPQS